MIAAKQVPDAVVTALAGRPTIDGWDTMFSFLTVDAAGFPHVCVLSRAELDADTERIFAVIAGPTTIRNLLERETATLVVVTDTATTVTKLRLEKPVSDGPWLGAILRVDSAKSDTLGVPQQPPRYLAAEAIAHEEQWERSERLLAFLKSLSQREI